jgi:hypothetical protein
LAIHVFFPVAFFLLTWMRKKTQAKIDRTMGPGFYQDSGQTRFRTWF